MLFKQNGTVSHIIPVYERDIVPEFFYEKHLPQPKLTGAQKIHMGVLDFIGKFKSSKRKPPIKSYMEITDLENHFVKIVIYYGNHKYFTMAQKKIQRTNGRNFPKMPVKMPLKTFTKRRKSDRLTAVTFHIVSPPLPPLWEGAAKPCPFRNCHARRSLIRGLSRAGRTRYGKEQSII